MMVKYVMNRHHIELCCKVFRNYLKSALKKDESFLEAILNHWRYRFGQQSIKIEKYILAHGLFISTYK